MRLPFSRTTLGWTIVFGVLLVVAWTRLRDALLSPEEQIRARIESLTEALEDREPRRFRSGLSDEFRDEATGYTRRDVLDAARYVLMPGTRYRATLEDDSGLEILELSEEDADPRTARVRVKCLIESRPSGANAPEASDADFRPWWDLTFTADLERRGGEWRIVRTSDVNHGDRPRL